MVKLSIRRERVTPKDKTHLRRAEEQAYTVMPPPLESGSLHLLHS